VGQPWRTKNFLKGKPPSNRTKNKELLPSKRTKKFWRENAFPQEQRLLKRENCFPAIFQVLCYLAEPILPKLGRIPYLDRQ